jgi:hypothetical protein
MLVIDIQILAGLRLAQADPAGPVAVYQHQVIDATINAVLL